MTRRPDNDSSPEREPTPLEQAALDWVVRCERGLTEDQERALADWLDADSWHRELFKEFGGTWSLMGSARAESCGVAAERTGEAAALLSFEADAFPRRRGAVRAMWWSLAAAAALAVGMAGWRHGGRHNATIATEIGASRQLTLSDGSTVALNTDSSVVPAFAPDERRVRLEKGEAFFQVAKDAARPFVVEAAGIGVQAVGTAFNVRVHPDAIEVLVTEGTVRVAPAASQSTGRADFAEVMAGQRIVVPTGAKPAAALDVAPTLAVAHMPADELQRRLAWQDGRLEFSETTLGEMAAEFNRYNRRKLIVSDGGLAAMRFGGSFRPDDRVGFVRMLRENFGIVAEEHRDETRLRAAGR